MLEMLDMINEVKKEARKATLEESFKLYREVEILERLMAFNKKAILHMRGMGRTWKVKYREMWSKPFWKGARGLLREYFTLKGNGTLKCSICGKNIGKSFVLHHLPEYYKGAFSCNLFHPSYINLLCSQRCHAKAHGGFK